MGQIARVLACTPPSASRAPENVTELRGVEGERDERSGPMDGLLLGVSGRIGSRTAAELIDRGHRVTGASRRGTVEGIENPALTTITADATDSADVAKLASAHDAVISALRPGEDDPPDVLPVMIESVIEGLRRANVERLIWTGGLHVAPDTRLIETEDFPEAARPVAEAAIEADERIEEVAGLQWTYAGPATFIELGERTGSYRTAEGEFVTDEEGTSYISMEDFAIALVDILEEERAIHT